MAWSSWFPWKFVVRRLARSHGFLDPIALLSRLERFAQPSEVAEPIELLRAGVVLHARGLINSRVIQHNLDWVWPYWVERQFDPKDRAFVPRAFSITNINLTHRNWTAVGVPDCASLPIIDPRGLVTPIYDGWSLDGWVVAKGGRLLLPSRAKTAEQRQIVQGGSEIETRTEQGRLALTTRSRVEMTPEGPCCFIEYRAESDEEGWFALALRPYNPEGVSFIHEVRLSEDRAAWKVNGTHSVFFSRPADMHHGSDYRSGDVFIHLRELDDSGEIECGVGMATAAALFRLEAGTPCGLTVRVPLPPEADAAPARAKTWDEALAPACSVKLADERIEFLYAAAIRSLILHSPLDVYPGPYTYKRFWFRDAAFIIHALLIAGLKERARRALDRFPSRQTAVGFFHSQDGEWDSNGEALWIFDRYCELTGEEAPPAWREPIVRGGRWIGRKRTSEHEDAPHAGLLPAGFSAEHLGPNDFYYWDDFWGAAGLRAGARMMRRYGDEATAGEFEREAASLLGSIERSLAGVARRLGRPAIPASPYRRLDAGTIGSIVAGYPLDLLEPDDARLRDTVNFLLTNCFVDGAFFQDMIHSGLNAYLTLEVAQLLLREGNPRLFDLIGSVAELATETGQWPEAIHPRTRGGCMGDGHHVWASAEWVLLIRNCLVREGSEGGLILGSGLSTEWVGQEKAAEIGPAPTAFGPVHVQFRRDGEDLVVNWRGDWFGAPPRVDIRVPGWEYKTLHGEEGSARLARRGAA